MTATTQAPALLSEERLQEIAAKPLWRADDMALVIASHRAQAAHIEAQGKEVERLKDCERLLLEKEDEAAEAWKIMGGAVARAAELEERVRTLEAATVQRDDALRILGDVLVDYLRPDGITEKQAIAVLLEKLDPHPAVIAANRGVLTPSPSPSAPTQEAETLAGELAGGLEEVANYFRHAIWPTDFTPIRNRVLDLVGKARSAGLSTTPKGSDQ